MQPGWCQPVRQEFMENECEALPGVAYPGVRDNRSTINTKTGYDDDDVYVYDTKSWRLVLHGEILCMFHIQLLAVQVPTSKPERTG